MGNNYLNNSLNTKPIPMKSLFSVLTLALFMLLSGQKAISKDKITTPKEQFGIIIGEDYTLNTYSK